MAIEMLEQKVLKTDRKLVKPRDNVDDLVKEMDGPERMKRPLLVHAHTYRLVDGLRRLRAVEKIGYKGPLPCQVIGFDNEAVETLMKYIADAREADGPMTFTRLYEIYKEFSELSNDYRTRNRRNGVKGLRFFEKFAAAAGLRPWQFGDYLTFRTRTLGHEDSREVMKYRAMIDAGEISAVTSTLRLGRLGIIDANPSDSRSIVPLTASGLTPAQQLKVLDNAVNHMEGIKSALLNMGRLDSSINSTTQPGFRKSIGEFKRVLTVLLKTFDDYGRESE